MTQTAESVKSLIEYRTGKPCEVMPEIVPLANGAQLTKCNKGDAYYFTNAKGCTCPGFQYRLKPCKHMRAMAKEKSTEEGGIPIEPMSMAEVLEEADRNLKNMPKNYQRMVRAAREDAEAITELGSTESFKPVVAGE